MPEPSIITELQLEFCVVPPYTFRVVLRYWGTHQVTAKGKHKVIVSINGGPYGLFISMVKVYKFLYQLAMVAIFIEATL